MAHENDEKDRTLSQQVLLLRFRLLISVNLSSSSVGHSKGRGYDGVMNRRNPERKIGGFLDKQPHKGQNCEFKESRGSERVEDGDCRP